MICGCKKKIRFIFEKKEKGNAMTSSSFGAGVKKKQGWSKKKTGLEKVSWPAYPNIHPIFNKFRVFIIHNSILIIIKNKKID